VGFFPGRARSRQMASRLPPGRQKAPCHQSRPNDLGSSSVRHDLSTECVDAAVCPKASGYSPMGARQHVRPAHAAGNSQVGQR
jgi:hypothetical protein